MNPTPSARTERPPRAVVGSQVSYDEEMFGEAFDGVVVRRFWHFVRPYRKMLWIGIAGVLIFTVSQVLIPLMVRYVIDDAVVAGADALELLNKIVLSFFAVVVVNYLANMMQELVVGRMAGHLLFDLRRAMYRHLQSVSLSFMDKTEVGRLMSRLQGDVNALQEFLETSIFAVGDFVLLLGIIGVLLWLDPRLGLFTLSVVPVLFIVRIVWLPYAREAFLTARETHSTVNGALAENVHGVRTIQEMSREAVNYRLFDEKADANLRAHLRASMFSNVMVPIVDTLTGVALAIVIVLGGTLVLDDALDIGVIVAFVFYVQRFFDPIRSLTTQYSVMQRAMASGQRIFEVLDVPLAVTDRPGAADPDEIEGRIEFRTVTFGYEAARPVLHDLSFTVSPGETVALVGPTGSGKTSIAALLHRFYEVWDGAILIDGRDVRDYAKASLARHVSMVLQDPYLFTGTIYENIRFNKAGATRDDIENAARVVGAHDFIVRLPDGYDTVLVELGRNLSLGQRQLLSFARALVADAKILILDEATASVDSYTERKIQIGLKRLLGGRTGIVIAHRLATVRGADRIIVLQDGRIVESGPHDVLIAEGGLYATLCAYNYASFDDAPAGLGAEKTRLGGT